MMSSLFESFNFSYKGFILFLVLLVGISLRANAQTIPVPSFSVNSTNGTCLSNGSIEVTIPTPVDPNTYEVGWIVELTNLSNTNSTPSSQTISSTGGVITFSSLSAANYRVVVKNSASTSLTPVDRTITTSYVSITVPSITETAPSCPSGTNGTMTINILGGVGPFIYSLRSTDPITKAVIAGGTNVVSSSTSARTFTFAGLKDGDHVTYTVTDACGAFTSSDRLLAKNSSIDLKFALMETNFFKECITLTDGSTDCNSMKMFVNLDINTMTGPRLESIWTPGNSTIKINGTVYNLTYSGLLTSQAYRFTYDPVAVGGPALKHNDDIEFSFNWGCKTLKKTMKVPMPINAFGTTFTPRINFSNCQVEYSISVFGSGGNPDRSVTYCSASSRIKIERVTSTGFVQVFPTSGEWGSFPAANQDDIFNSISVGLVVQDPGDYRFTVSDGCQTKTDIRNIPVADNPVSGIQVSTIDGVSDGTAGLRFGGMSNGLEYNIKITPDDPNAPSSIVIPAGTAPLNYNSTSKELKFPFEASFVGPIDIVDLPLGSYKVELSPIVTNSTGVVCSGSVQKTQIVNLVNGASYNPNFNVVGGCLNGNVITYALNAQRALTPSGVKLFRKNPNGSFAEIASNSSLSGQFSNQGGGDYRLVFERGGNSFYSAIHKRRGQFSYSKDITIAPYADISLNITTVFCNPTNPSANAGNISVVVSNSSTLIYPLRMTLLGSNGAVVRSEVTLTSPIREHVFTALPVGSYSVEVTSACSGLTQPVQLALATSPPSSTASQVLICKGSTSDLSALNATNQLYNIEWFILNSDLTRGPSVGTGMPLQVQPSSTTTYRGVYVLKEIFSCDTSTPLTFESDVSVTVLEDPKIDLVVSDIELCPGSSRSVTISNSESGFKYEVLDKLGNSYSPVVEFNGNGGSLTFNLPNQVTLTPGESLMVRTTRISLGCTGILTDKIVISRTALNTSLVVQGSAVCANSAGTITVKAAQAGVTYTVLKAGQPLSPSVSAVGNGTDLPLSIPASNLTAATNEFSVRASGTGCVVAELAQKASITILQVPAVTELVHAVCGEQKGKIVLSASGGSGNYEFSIDNITWVTSNTFTDLNPGTYTVSVKDLTLNCTVERTVEVLNHCIEITKTSSSVNYEDRGEIVDYTITVKNTGNVALSNISVKDPLTGMDETISSLAVLGISEFPTNYTTTTAELGTNKLDNTATATMTIGGVVFDKSASVSIPNAFQVDDLDCTPERYTISKDVEIQLEIRVPYSGGTAATYEQGEPILLGNGTIKATLQAGQINPNGGELVYLVEGKATSDTVMNFPVAFGGKSCLITILITEAASASISFSVNTYEDLNGNCTKDGAEVQNPDSTDGLFIKIFDLNDNLLYSEAAQLGQFEVQDFSGESNVIYYYILDDNEDAIDPTPTLLTGWASGMAPLKRYFHFSNGVVSFNAARKDNLLDATWKTTPESICLNRVSGLIDSLDCEKDLSITLYKGIPVNESFLIDYLGGNGGTYGRLVIESTGVKGLTATLESGLFENGDGSLEFILTGTPLTGGESVYQLTIGGKSCNLRIQVLDPSVSVVKTSTKSTYTLAGEKIEYKIDVQNNGNVTLTNVIVTDPLTGFSETIPSLIPNESKSFSTDYLIKQSDIEAGNLVNKAFANYNYGGAPYEKTGVLTLKALKNPSVKIVKESTQSGFKEVGDELTYTITVTNNGNVNLSNLTVRDPLTGMTRTISSLGVGKTETFTTNYVVTQTDINSGMIRNTAVADYSYDGKPTSSSTLKDLDFTGVRTVIQAVSDDFKNVPINVFVTNTAGNVLTNDLMNGLPVVASAVQIKVTDDGGITGISIAANGDIVLPATTPPGTYTIKYSICDIKNLSNCSETTVVILVTNGVDLRITKEAEGSNWFEGDEFTYTLTVENIGSSPASAIEIVDNLPTSLRYLSSQITGGVGTVSVSGQALTWKVASIAAGGTVKITMKVKILALADENKITISNIGTVSSFETDWNTADNTSLVTIQVEPFFIPNVITPNGDGLNDQFEIKGLGKFVSNNLIIWNRWGDHILDQSDYKNDWSAVGLMNGTYYYMLKTVDEADKEHVFKGWIQVIARN
jgi:uncharacterized repeat protein (TIGR01451 family)/gliding motility-associated-like protein